MALIPWVMFAITALLTAVGSVVPAAVAIVAPIALGFARRYNINPFMMGLMVVNGATAGGFSPISIFGSIVNGVVERNDLAGNPTLLFFSSLIFNTLLSVVVFFAFGGRDLLHRRVDTEPEADRALQARDDQGRLADDRRRRRRHRRRGARRSTATASSPWSASPRWSRWRWRPASTGTSASSPSRSPSSSRC